MSFFDSLHHDELLSIAPYLEAVGFAAGDCLIEQGSAGDDLYLVDSGRVRLELRSPELDSDTVLTFLEAGQVVGEFSLFDRGRRSASVYADTEVTARRLTREGLDALCRDHPRLGLALLSYIAEDFAHKLRRMDARLGTYLAEGLAPRWVDDMVHAAGVAQAAFAALPDELVDTIVVEILGEVGLQADRLAAEEVAETGLGCSEHKSRKLAQACRLLGEDLVCAPAVGERRLANGLVERREPVGVVLGIIPLTNALPTLLYWALCCLKTRNALVASCPHATLGVGGRLGEIIRAVLIRHDISPDLVQWIHREASRSTTAAFMGHQGIALIIASAGAAVLRAAHGSGRPALGMGACNAPVWVADDADLALAATLIVESKSFDHGLTPGAEHNLVVDEQVAETFAAALQAAGAVVLSAYEADVLTRGAIDPRTGSLRTEVVGQSAASILADAGLDRGVDVRLVVVPQPVDKLLGPWGQEKLAPIVSLFVANGETEALALCGHLLAAMGAGHTAVVHTADEARARRFGAALPAGRILHNLGASSAAHGIGCALPYSWTLGGGSWAGTSSADNLGLAHLVNVKRLAGPTA